MADWKMPPKIKILEALGSLADERVEVDTIGANVTSSSRAKTYRVTYDEKTHALSSNDNASYWQGYVGYPGIAYLMKLGALPFDPRVADWLRGIPWKDINSKFKNDYAKTEDFIRNEIAPREDVDLALLDDLVDQIINALRDLHLQRTGRGQEPPKGK